MRLYSPKSEALVGKMESTPGDEGPGASESGSAVTLLCGLSDTSAEIVSSLLFSSHVTDDRKRPTG
jgi:hypothetical protein